MLTKLNCILLGYSSAREEEVRESRRQKELHLEETIINLSLISILTPFQKRFFIKMSRFLDDLILHVTPDKFYVESLSEQQVCGLIFI